MGGKFEIGKVAGIPVVVDASFLLLLLLWGHTMFTGASSSALSVGFVLVLGAIASILLHEVAHHLTARAFGFHADYMILTGLGSASVWPAALPVLLRPRLAIHLAGPAANGVLSVLFAILDRILEQLGLTSLAGTCELLAAINLLLLLYNLLPAYPLDGGYVFQFLFAPLVGGTRAAQAVGALGLLAAAGLAYLAFAETVSLWLLVLAVLLAITNGLTLASASGVLGHDPN
jgi:Zn-dependent protease